jgi:hypothetical protein
VKVRRALLCAAPFRHGREGGQPRQVYCASSAPVVKLAAPASASPHLVCRKLAWMAAFAARTMKLEVMWDTASGQPPVRVCDSSEVAVPASLSPPRCPSYSMRMLPLTLTLSPYAQERYGARGCSFSPSPHAYGERVGVRGSRWFGECCNRARSMLCASVAHSQPRL